jgi:hypothetical protein
VIESEDEELGCWGGVRGDGLALVHDTVKNYDAKEAGGARESS